VNADCELKIGDFGLYFHTVFFHNFEADTKIKNDIYWISKYCKKA